MYGGLTFTVPAGWAMAGDHTSDFRLLRSSDYAKEGSNGPTAQQTGIEGWIRQAAIRQTPTCSAGDDLNVERTPGGLTAYLSKRSGLSASAVQDITIDGHPGKWIDVRVASGSNGSCVGGHLTIPLVTEAVGSAGSVGDAPYTVGISGQSRYRIIFVDIGKSDQGTEMTAMILITAPDKATFDAFIDQAMPIVQSFHFK
jgi:hypothetical protein